MATIRLKNPVPRRTIPFKGIFVWAFCTMLSSFLLIGSVSAQIVGGYGTYSGTVNGISLDATANVSVDIMTGCVSGDVSPVPDSSGLALLNCGSVITVVCASACQEHAGALNLYSLTGGVLQRTMTVEYGTGEVLTMVHDCSPDGFGYLVYTAEINGSAPYYPPEANVQIEDYEEIWTQVNDTSISLTSTRLYTVDGIPYDYVWTAMVYYDGAVQLPFNQKRIVTDASSSFTPATQTLHFDLCNNVFPLGVIPTLTEWGMIIFCALLFGWMAWVIVRRRRRVTVGI